jgi:hypothetical protein
MNERDLFIDEIKRLMCRLGYGEHPRLIDTTKDSVVIRYDWLVPVMDGDRVLLIDEQIQYVSRAVYVTASGREIRMNATPEMAAGLARGRVLIALRQLWDEVLNDDRAAA